MNMESVEISNFVVVHVAAQGPISTSGTPVEDNSDNHRLQDAEMYCRK